jgi:CspA family cold shock protein
MAVGRVKHFDLMKGFGFIVVDDGSPDVFVHIKEVLRSGLSELAYGNIVSFDIEAHGANGRRRATNLAMIDNSIASFRPDQNARRSELENVGAGSGVVKWFDPAKGFGFIVPSQGGGDIFVHASALKTLGRRTLEVGQGISYQLRRDVRTGKTYAEDLQLMSH